MLYGNLFKREKFKEFVWLLSREIMQKQQNLQRKALKTYRTFFKKTNKKTHLQTGLSLLEQEAAEPCSRHRRWRRRLHRPSAGYRRLPVGTEGSPSHKG